MSLLKSSLLIILFVWSTKSQPSNNDIQTSSGPVRGTEVTFNGHLVDQYLGIPFAKPPVGELRFKKPEPVEPWTETYVADTMPPACIQYAEYPFPWYDFEDGKSEDCLYLNIWVPKSLISDFGNISVMFWIQGVGFNVGSNRKPIYEGQVLTGEGGVIVVTVNYRLNAFGFLSSGSKEAPGNVGLYDMLAALKWVNQNIAAFGGDPNQVTLFGHSGGSVAVGTLCVSPLTEGLFHRVIMQSGSPTYLLSEDNTANIARGQSLAKAVGCANDTTTIGEDPEVVVSCLRNVDPFVLVKTLTSLDPTAPATFFPMYGDEIVPQKPRIEIINGNFRNVDVLIGTEKDGGAFQMTVVNPDIFGFFGEKNPQINKSYGEMMMRNIFSQLPDTDAVVQQYLGDLREDDYDRVREQVHTSLGDFTLVCPSVYFAERYSQAGNDVHYYSFEHRPSTTPWAEWMGVVHAEEIQFVFGVPLRQSFNYTTQEIVLSRRMINIWTNFAKRGTTGRSDWRRYSRADPTYVELDTAEKPNYGEGPHKSNCDFFRKYFGFE